MNADPELGKLLHKTGNSAGMQISGVSTLAGGSINNVYLLETTSGKRVLKVNTAADFPEMFEAEKTGLEILGSYSSFTVPHVLALGTSGNLSFLLLEHIEAGQRSEHFWTRFAEDLAGLHKNSAPAFGFPASNYIGSLPQVNASTETASEFYITQRMEPQFRMAVDAGYEFPALQICLKNIAAEIPPEPPALIHGDLWNGNYLISHQGLPCLIDPAVSYGPREMDLAMMKLFGGFPEEVFLHYSEVFPITPGFQDRVLLWQLYYLLVHLNIFGKAYLPQVKAVLRKYC